MHGIRCHEHLNKSQDIIFEARLPELYTKEPDKHSEFITKVSKERESACE